MGTAMRTSLKCLLFCLSLIVTTVAVVAFSRVTSKSESNENNRNGGSPAKLEDDHEFLISTDKDDIKIDSLKNISRSRNELKTLNRQVNSTDAKLFYGLPRDIIVEMATKRHLILICALLNTQ